MNSLRRPIISFTPNPWDQDWSSRHRILSGLGRREWQVACSSGLMSLWARGGADWAKAPWLGRFERRNEVLFDRPGKLAAHWPKSAMWDAFARRRHAQRLLKAVRQEPADDAIALLFHPEFWPYVRDLKTRYVVYYAYDAFSLSPGWTSELADREAALVARADLIIAFSDAMIARLPGRGPETGRELPTGVDTDLFVSAASCTCPRDLTEVPHPRIGYIGKINQKLDLALVLELAARRPDWHWVFLGRVGANDQGIIEQNSDADTDWQQCLSRENIHYLGSKNFADVPAYVNHMDVNTMCYRTGGGWWEAGYPLKMHEYLAAGKPVVSTDLETVRPFSHVVDIVRTPNEWISAIVRALDSGGVGTVEERRAVANENTWEKRVDQLESWLLNMTASR